MAALEWPHSGNENEGDREYFKSLSWAFINACVMDEKDAERGMLIITLYFSLSRAEGGSKGTKVNSPCSCSQPVFIYLQWQYFVLFHVTGSLKESMHKNIIFAAEHTYNSFLCL